MKINKQFIRYVIVGMASNIISYAVYIILTGFGLGPKIAMSLLYGIGVMQTFIFNKKWSFGFSGAAAPAFLRYVTVYVFGYVIAIAALMLLVDRIGLPHRLVMAGLVLFMAVFFFAGQKLWVFRQTPTSKMGD